LIKKEAQMAEQKKERVVYHVTPDASATRWVVSQEKAEFRREFDNKDEAITFAKERARGQEPSQVKVHRHDGNLEYESTYGDDPRNIPG
jgi:hypothetical protein